MIELVVARAPGGAHAGLLEAGQLTEYFPATTGGIGAVYLGRVVRVEPALGAAFVDLGEPEPAWLGRHEARFVAGATKERTIGQVVHEGQALIVQVSRPGLAGKGPRVTTDVVLESLCAMARPHRAAPDDPELLARWRAILERAAHAKPPALLHEPDGLERILRHGLERGAGRIVADDHLTFVRVRSLLDRGGVTAGLSHEPGAWASTGVQAGLADALEPEVPLAGGGSIIIETTRALTAVDVNGGNRSPLETNLEAVGAIARALRLRRIGGIVVIDFVDLRRAADRDRVVAALGNALADDRSAVDVLPMSRLGLVQLTRQRTGPGLEELLTRPCPTCAGRGRLVTDQEVHDA